MSEWIESLKWGWAWEMTAATFVFMAVVVIAVHVLMKVLFCEHESDGKVYTSCPPKKKCIKCGEHYDHD